MNALRIHVAMCVDHGYAIPLAVALKSLDEASAADDVTVYVLHPGLASETRARITAPLQVLDVRWIAVNDAEVAGAFYTDELSSASLYRLLLGRVLPSDCDRVIYLDSDIYVSDSLAPLYATDLVGYPVGAVRDAPSPWAAGPVGTPWRDLGLDPASPNLNTGVLLIDLNEWRSQRIGEQALEILRGKSPRWGDQDALNTVFGDKWLELPRRWNLQTHDVAGDAAAWALWREDVEAAVASPAINHLTTTDKPWRFGATHPRTAEWFEWLDRTSWAGWRPVEPKENPVVAAARAALRRLRAVQQRQHLNSAGLPE